MSKYLSPLVCCIECRDIKSAKGIFSHFNLAHTEDKQRPSEESKVTKSKKISERRQEAFDEKINRYNEAPNICKCGKPKQYKQRHNKYCGSSCAATFSNSEKIFQKPRKKQPKKVCSIKYKECPQCSSIFLTSSHKGNKNSILCSEECLHKRRQELGSISAKKNNFGGVRQSKRILYNGVLLGSTYEVTLAKSLDEYGVKWSLPQKISYTDLSGKKHTYTADFYLPDYDVYLDPKNDFLINNINPALGYSDHDKIKWVTEQNGVRIIILSKEQLSWDSVSKLVGDENYDISASTV